MKLIAISIVGLAAVIALTSRFLERRRQRAEAAVQERDAPRRSVNRRTETAQAPYDFALAVKARRRSDAKFRKRIWRLKPPKAVGTVTPFRVKKASR